MYSSLVFILCFKTHRVIQILTYCPCIRSQNKISINIALTYIIQSSSFCNTSVREKALVLMFNEFLLVSLNNYFKSYKLINCLFKKFHSPSLYTLRSFSRLPLLLCFFHGLPAIDVMLPLTLPPPILTPPV